MFVQLMSGSQMPLTGFGTWKLREPELEPAIRAALKVGYRHFDGAAIYENESELGRVFQSIIFNEQFVSRSEVNFGGFSKIHGFLFLAVYYIQIVGDQHETSVGSSGM